MKNNEYSLPCNIEAEQNLLGLLLANNDHLYKVSEFLLSKHFYLPVHSMIFNIIVQIVERGLSANIISIRNYLKDEAIFKEAKIDSNKYLVKIFSEAKLHIDIYTLAKSIQDAYIRRKIVNINEYYIFKAKNEKIEQTAEEILDNQEQELFVLSSQNSNDINCFSLHDSLNKVVDKLKKAKIKNNAVSGVDTGYYKLNEYTGGFQSSDLVIIAGRPSMGKTALAINIAIKIAKEFHSNSIEKKSIVFFSLEMSAEQIASRILSIETDIDSAKMRIGKIESKEMTNIADQIVRISDLPFFIDDTPAITVSMIRARARRMKRQNGVSMLVVDYLQLVRSSNLTKENRVQEIGEISKGLKAIAKELDIPVVAISQLSRAVENREDKRPLLSDLRESGNIEQDADLVVFIYREEYYLSRQRPTNDIRLDDWQDRMRKVGNIAEINIAKQRNGPVGSFFLRYDSTTTSFDNLA